MIYIYIYKYISFVEKNPKIMCKCQANYVNAKKAKLIASVLNLREETN